MDDIGEDPWFGGGISAAAFTDSLSGLRGPLDVHISSQGGMVDQGLAIYNALASYKGPVTTYNDGIAASIASVIMQAGSKRVASPVSVMMLHDAWGDPGPGNAADMEAMRAALDKNSDVIARAYADRAGGTVASWREVMQNTAWYDADDALKAGLIDEIAGGSKLPGTVDLDALAAAKAPTRIMAALRAAADDGSGDGDGTGQSCKTCGGKGRLPHPGTGKNGMTCPGCGGSGTYDPAAAPDGDGDPDEGMELGDRGPAVHAKAGDEQLGSGWVKGADGKVRFDPDGDGDDDSTPEGDTDHDYFDADGKQIKPIPPRPPAAKDEGPDLWAVYRMAVRDAGKVDNSPWDSSKAWSAGAASDDPAAFYAGICAGEKAGDKSTQAAWALPYRYAPGDPPNEKGVEAALAALNGARGGVQGLTNEAEAKKTLQAAMKQVNPDWEPEDSTTASISAADALERYRAALKGAQT
jgi:ATP-dependent protease ClpP protease subunit